MKNDLPQILTIEEASGYLRIPLSTLYKLAQEGRVPCQKVGRHWRFDQATLKEWIAGNNLSIYSNKISIDESRSHEE
ncbi:MAG: helix-turn-helix domain-containing protein [Anaerolineaceae bacterium]|jgi:excisionase family DNA binding protein